MPKKLLNSPAFLIACVAAIAAALMSPKTQSLVEALADSTSSRTIAMSEHWEVVNVADGDTITVKRGNETKKIRFCGIDAPESKQPLGKESKVNLERLSKEVGGQVSIVPVESDRYGRLVAEVFSSPPNKDNIEKFWNEEQLSSGLAMVYRSYVKKCPNAIALGKAEEIAKNKKLGVWGDSSNVPPWEFRKRQRQNNGN